MLKIYAIPVSLYCAKLRILLRHKKLEWQEVPPPGGYGSSEYKELVPGGSLPALQHDDFLLSDSEAIAEYLNERFPEPQMLPGNAVERAKVRELSRFHDTRLEPALRALFPHISSDTRDTEFVLQQWTALQERLAQIVPLLPLDHRALTLANCGLPITCVWIKALGLHFEMEPILGDPMQAYLATLSTHPAVEAELREYKPRLKDWLASK